MSFDKRWIAKAVVCPLYENTNIVYIYNYSVYRQCVCIHINLYADIIYIFVYKYIEVYCKYNTFAYISCKGAEINHNFYETMRLSKSDCHKT